MFVELFCSKLNNNFTATLHFTNVTDTNTTTRGNKCRMQTWDKSNCRRVELQSDRKVDHPGMMQEFDQPLIEKFELFLKGDQKCNFLSGITNIDMNIEVRKKYPVLMKILEASVDQDGTIAKPLRYDCY